MLPEYVKREVQSYSSRMQTPDFFFFPSQFPGLSKRIEDKSSQNALKPLSVHVISSLTSQQHPISLCSQC